MARCGRAADLERRRHPGARRRTGADPRRAARRRCRHAEPLHRGGGQRHRRRLASTRRTAIRSPVRNSTTSSPGTSGLRRMPPNCFDTGLPVVLAGDYNIVPEPRDIYADPLLRRQRAGAAGKPRRVRSGCSTQGWIDALRKMHPNETLYTFWDYRRNRWPRDAGLRLDHILLSENTRPPPRRRRHRPRRARAATAPATMRRCGRYCGTSDAGRDHLALRPRGATILENKPLFQARMSRVSHPFPFALSRVGRRRGTVG